MILRVRIFWACAAICAVPMIAAAVHGPFPEPLREQPKKTELTPWGRAEVNCMAIWYSPEYRASSAGGDYRHRADELCDECGATRRVR
jgi:hypothetical protein